MEEIWTEIMECKSIIISHMTSKIVSQVNALHGLVILFIIDSESENQKPYFNDDIPEIWIDTIHKIIWQGLKRRYGTNSGRIKFNIMSIEYHLVDSKLRHFELVADQVVIQACKYIDDMF